MSDQTLHIAMHPWYLMLMAFLRVLKPQPMFLSILLSPPPWNLTRPQIEQSLRKLNPNFVFLTPVTGYVLSPERKLTAKPLVESDYKEPPLSFPSSSIKLRTHEARGQVHFINHESGHGMTFLERMLTGFSDCDAIGFKTCREFEGPFCDYLETQMRKPIILSGPVVSDPPSSQLEEKWEKMAWRVRTQNRDFLCFRQ
ncbi:hypothetical protein M0R45_025818 [Rubus argutus]|uniref:Uncharacterized protein n=1 Tax=Rubus argutus TaxID=59490 RepID=A0AAW1WZC1_RUBAR